MASTGQFILPKEGLIDWRSMRPQPIVPKIVRPESYIDSPDWEKLTRLASSIIEYAEPLPHRVGNMVGHQRTHEWTATGDILKLSDFVAVGLSKFYRLSRAHLENKTLKHVKVKIWGFNPEHRIFDVLFEQYMGGIQFNELASTVVGAIDWDMTEAIGILDQESFISNVERMANGQA